MVTIPLQRAEIQEVKVREVSVTKVCVSPVLYFSSQLWSTSIGKNYNGGVSPMQQFNQT